MRILTFADMGIGNFIFYLPVLRALAKEDLTVICPNEQLRAILDYNIKAKYEIQGKFDVSVNNFLSQDKRHLTKIWEIPKRIGHKAWWRDRSWIFTDKVPMDRDKSEEYYNCKLLEPLGIKPIFKPLRVPDFNTPQYDIIISKHSSELKKDWEYWGDLKLFLKLKYPGITIKILDSNEIPLIVVCDILRKCKLFIGNDSGLAKIAANLGTPTIQIFRWFTDCFVRARVKGINLIEPTVEEVICQLNSVLSAVET